MDALLPDLVAPILIASCGYDAEARVLIVLHDAGKVVGITPKGHRATHREYDRDLYGARAIATRYDKTKRNFFVTSYLVATAFCQVSSNAVATRLRSPKGASAPYRHPHGARRDAPVQSNPGQGSIRAGGDSVATLIDRLGLTVPIIQAPMAGVATPTLAAAVSEAGALGSIAVGATDAAGARAMLATVRAATARPVNVNAFAHAPASADPGREAAWLVALAPHFAAVGAAPPATLRAIYPSFREDAAMLAALVEAAPAVVSFHFGLPDDEQIAALKRAGCLLIATATNLEEGRAAQRAGLDAVVAQGFEAGGHRGVFDPAAPDDCLTTLALTRLLVRTLDLPVIAAGGIMDGAGIAAALALGAVAVQLGTAFIACPESSADAAFRAALLVGPTARTVLTTAISGRPARCLANRFTALGQDLAALPRPDYPIAYDAGKALHAAATARGETGYGAHWAGQGAPLARALPASHLVAALAEELRLARS